MNRMLLKLAGRRPCRIFSFLVLDPPPEPLPEPLPPHVRKICCTMGTIRAKSHQPCLVLVPGQCQTIVRDCCSCCTSGMNDAQSLSSASSCKAQKKKPFEECRAARQLCCEDSLSNTADVCCRSVVICLNSRAETDRRSCNNSSNTRYDNMYVLPPRTSSTLDTVTYFGNAHIHAKSCFMSS